MKRFSEFKIEAPAGAFEGKKISLEDLFNVSIIVRAFRIEESKFTGKNRSNNRLQLAIEYNNEKFITFTGSDTLMEMTYNSITDIWTVNDLVSGTYRKLERMKAIGIFEKNGYIYWGSDGTSPDNNVGGIAYESKGIYRALVADLNDITKHQLLQALTDECYAFLRLQDNVIFCGMDVGESTHFYISRDAGDTWEEKLYLYDIADAARPAHFDKTNNYLLMLNNTVIQLL